MNERTLITLILIGIILLWVTETLGMKRSRKIMSGIVDIGIQAIR